MKLFHCVLPPGYPDKKMHPNTLENINEWISINNDIEIEQCVFSYQECCDFILKYFDKELLSYFIKQPMGHFKSDLWRLCVLYIYGGAYADIDQKLLTKFSDFFNVGYHDFCGVTNMERYNLSNGFIYAKKNNLIIEKNIELTYEKYHQAMNNGKITDVKFIGGCYIMGEVIANLENNPVMPIGEKLVADSKCMFLHEVGDKSLEKTNKQAFWNSFHVLSGDKKVMVSRYENYFLDRSRRTEFIKV